jgi:sec-independent protein translocase protein TatA
MLQNLTGWHFLIILVVILLLFGAPKLPGLARSLGQSMKIFKSEIKSDKVDEDPDAPQPNTTQSTSADETRKAAGPADTNPKP